MGIAEDLGLSSVREEGELAKLERLCFVEDGEGGVASVIRIGAITEDLEEV